MLKQLTILSAYLLSSFFAPVLMAQDAAKDYPNKVITFIVPYAAGGSSDTRARMIAQKLTAYLGKSVVVENKSGANGNIGTAAIAKAAPDGYTIGIGNLAPLAVNKVLLPATTNFDPDKEIAPVVLVEKGPILLLVNADKSPHKDAASLVKALKEANGKMSYASAGLGGSYHLSSETFLSTVGASAVHVPYRSGGQAITDLIAGQVDYMFDMAPATLGYLTSTPPRMRALAVAHDKRLPSLPNVPTFAEQGFKNLELSNWIGVIAPKGTPTGIIDKLNKAINRALLEPDVIKAITEPGNVIGGGDPKVFADFIASESARWTKLIKEKNIKAE